MVDEFKTNTTNKAIDYYSTMGNMRMDMRLDAIEDALGDVGWKLAQLCLRFMDAADSAGAYWNGCVSVLEATRQPDVTSHSMSASQSLVAAHRS